MEGTGVLFLDGDNRGTMVFGLPDLPEWKRVIPMDVMLSERWCGDEECCAPPDEPDVEVYHLVSLGRFVRVATMDRDLAKDKDRLAFKLAETAAYFEGCSPMAEYRRIRERNRAAALSKSNPTGKPRP